MERKSCKSNGDAEETGGEISQLREMIWDLRQMQKAIITPGTGVVAGRTKEDVIPLDTYGVGQGYGRYPYGRRDTAHPITRPTEYPDRCGQVSQPADYYQERRGGYPTSHEGSHQETAHIGPPTHSYFDNFTWQLTQGSRFPPVSNPPLSNSPPPRTCGNAPGPQSIGGPNGVLYYLSRPRTCYQCGEEGHLRPQCPRFHAPIPATRVLGPEHPDTLSQPKEESSAQAGGRPVNVIEIAARSSALDGMKVREVTATTVEPQADL